jgi:dihydrofolate synthase/folylpolyglutamate synthase
MGDQRLQTYGDALQWIHSLMTFGIKPGLKRMEWMLERLDHPERHLKFIHVAGTNGKGSTSSFLATILQKAGYDVGLYTSPYMERFTNRIKLNGEDISEEDIVELVQLIEPLVHELAKTELGSPTEFEVVTTLAILYYGKKAFPDFIVWEAGLGGRLDSTNVVTPILSIITNVGMDHQDYLGHTIEDIAREKAGIIKPGVSVITGIDHPSALQVVSQVAELKKSSMYVLGNSFSAGGLEVTREMTSFDWEGPYQSYSRLSIRLRGEHQVKNASLAIMASEWLRQFMVTLVDEKDLRTGLAETVWAGRLETISDEPEIIVDGAHNPQGMEALAAALPKYFPHRTIHVLIGVLGDKSLDGFFEPLLPLVGPITVTKPSFRRAGSTERIVEKIRAIQPNHEVHSEDDWVRAFHKAVHSLQKEDILLVTGSLYLISDIRNMVLEAKQRKVGETP